MSNGNIVMFPRHRTTSRFSAAKRAKSSAVTPALMATSLEVMESHHSEGIRSRSRHLRTRSLDVSKSEAIASDEAQSSITSLNDVMRAMSDTVGQSVLDGKANLSTDNYGQNVHTGKMPKDERKRAFAKEFAKRIKAAREPLYSQATMADLLEVPQDHYKHFETKRVMPHHLIGRFCTLTHISADQLFTAEGERAAVPPPVRKPKREKAIRPSRGKIVRVVNR